MLHSLKRNFLFFTFLFFVLFILISGCSQSTISAEIQKEIEDDFGIDATIGSLVDVYSTDIIPVEGIALVGGLDGTGSVKCPPGVKNYLKKYIMEKLDRKSNIEEFINSENTAPVVVQGVMPTLKSRNEKFDVKISIVPNTDTTSLNGGQLWGVDLYEKGRMGDALRLLATAEGSVYIDRLEFDKKTDYTSGYVLNAGRSRDEYKISLILKKPNYKTAAAVRNRINERFESDTAQAVSPDAIRVRVPKYYKKQKRRFIAVVRSLYLIDNKELNEKRVKKHTRQMIVGSEKYRHEIFLEALGSQGKNRLKVLLNSSNTDVRLRAARCLLDIGSEDGLNVLRELALEENSDYSKQALQAIAKAAGRDQISSVARRLLYSQNLDLKLTAYEILADIGDIYINRQFVGGNVFLDRITQTDKKLIYAYRKNRPRIVIFSAPLSLKGDIFAQTSDGKITVNAPAGAGEVTILRKHPGKSYKQPIRLKSSFELEDIIQTLVNPPVTTKGSGRSPGIGATYGQTLEIIKKLTQSPVLDAEFVAGELPKIP
jgi:flagellar basal body P-ring protein FlgI/glutaredoxin-related protein